MMPLQDTLYADAAGRLDQLIDQARARAEELHVSAAKLLADANTTNGAALETERWIEMLIVERDERKRLEERAVRRDFVPLSVSEASPKQRTERDE